jgi:hypothetical protein
MSIKTKALRYALRLARKRKGLKVKELKTVTLARYIYKSGQKRKFTETERAANKLKAKQQHYENLKKKGPRIQAKTDIQYKFKQKPKTGGGRQVLTAKGSSYGIGAREHEITSPVLKLATRRGSFKGARHLDQSWYSEMKRMYGGVHMSQDPKLVKKSIKVLAKKLKKKKVVKALRGILIKKGTKLAYRLATKKYPQIFKKRKLSTAELKTKKIRKTPELASLGVTKIAANDLRKLAVAQAIKSRITHLGNIAIKHHKKAVSLFWGKAKHIEAIVKLEKYHKPATKRKLESLGKQYANLSKYQDTLKAKTATKHSEGGEVVISKNVDRSLL